MRRAPSSPPALAGLRFERQIGSGGFSDVFLYEQEFPRRNVAVKVLLTDEVTDSERAAFVAEANLMAQLSTHPYIVSIYSAAISDDGRPYLVMEYCPGPSLGEQYKVRPLSVDDALRTGIRMAGAVATAHGAGVLHGDIKPANILTNDFGWPALTDFGIASALDDEVPMQTISASASVSDTGTGTANQVGMSIPWSPAEMFADDPNPDVRSDVFSLAATIYTVLAGRTPFEAPGRSNGALDLIGRIERGVIAPMDRGDVPRTLLAVLTKGMATNREDRFESAVAFGRALQRVEAELGYAPTALDVPNLVEHISSPPAGAGADGDETRVRQVTEVIAQPDAEPTQVRTAPVAVEAQPVEPTRIRPAATTVDAQPVERTIVRPDRTVEAQPIAPTPAPAEPEVEAPARPRRLPMLIGAVVGAVVIGAVVTAVVVGVGGGADPTEPGGSGPAVNQGLPPAPATIVGSLENGGRQAVFQVGVPTAENGDQVRWIRSGTTKTEFADVQNGAATIRFRVPDRGIDVCVSVASVRDGVVSPEKTGCTE